MVWVLAVFLAAVKSRLMKKKKTLTMPNGEVYKEGDYISLDGSTGNVYGGQIKTVEPSISGDFGTFMGWADKARTLKIRTNADNPRDARQARAFGAEGIGLCRTEHMFFEEDRIFNFRRMITAPTLEARKEALEKIFTISKTGLRRVVPFYGRRSSRNSLPRYHFMNSYHIRMKKSNHLPRV